MISADAKANAKHTGNKRNGAVYQIIFKQPLKFEMQCRKYV